MFFFDILVFHPEKLKLPMSKNYAHRENELKTIDFYFKYYKNLLRPILSVYYKHDLHIYIVTFSLLCSCTILFK